jgi:hypothetical protein
MPHFDDLPTIRPPNPLPCGCAMVGQEGINLSGTVMEYKDQHIRFCALHAAAEELLAFAAQCVQDKLGVSPNKRNRAADILAKIAAGRQNSESKRAMEQET